MKRFWLVSVIIVITALGLALFTEYDGDASVTHVLGMPVVGLGRVDPCWLALGGTGGLVLGAGVGVVCYALYGAGLLMATGQLTGALGIAFGQLGVGGVFYCGQVGAGLTGLGQGIAGYRVAGQGTLGGAGATFLRQLDRSLDEILSFR